MKLGILSDTHDRMPFIEQAVKVFNEREMDLVIHVGDYCAPFSLEPLKGLKMDWIGVFGNNDGEIQGLLKASNGRIKDGNLILEREGKRILVDHVNPLRSFLTSSGGFDLILYGHTHTIEVYESNGCLCVNPGEVCGYLTQKHTVVCLDLHHLNPEDVEVIHLSG